MKSAPLGFCVGGRRALLAMVFLFFAAWASAQVESELEGIWSMEDETPALMHPSNAERFVIQRVVPAKSQWADGTFYLRWPTETRPEQGYYSNANGRVWITTYRWVDNERVRVEYRGEIKRKQGKLTWEGAARTTSGKRTTWEFVATLTQ